MSTGGIFQLLNNQGSIDRLLQGFLAVRESLRNSRPRSQKREKFFDPHAYYISADQIIPGVWVGNQAASQSVPFLKKHKITVVVNCTKHIPFPKMPGIFYRIPVNDPGPGQTIDQDDVARMYSELNNVVNFIQYQVSHGRNVLIHCHAGMQRSAVVAAAYLTKLFYVSDVEQHRQSINSANAMPIEGARQLMKKRSVDRALKFLVDHRPLVFYHGNLINFAPALYRWVDYELI